MADVVVTVPRSFGLERWIEEGDPAGVQEWSGQEWHFYLWGPIPDIRPGERVYVCYNGALRGYAPLVRVDHLGRNHFGLVRHSGAVAVTIAEYIQGFRGFRYRWWPYEIEVPFPNWQDPDAGLVQRPGKVRPCKSRAGTKTELRNLSLFS
jgi:hypothetical protein